MAQVFSCEFCEISMNIFSYRTPPVAAISEIEEIKIRMRLNKIGRSFLGQCFSKTYPVSAPRWVQKTLS